MSALARKRTLIGNTSMSASCQQQTSSWRALGSRCSSAARDDAGARLSVIRDIGTSLEDVHIRFGHSRPNHSIQRRAKSFLIDAPIRLLLREFIADKIGD